MSFSSKQVGAWIGIAGIVMFSAKAVMVKMGYRYDVDTVTLLLLRMLFALPFYLMVILNQQRKGKSQPLSRKDLIRIVGLGFIGYYLASYFDFFGLQYISASLERLILFVYPTLVLILGWLIQKKSVSRAQALAVVITYLGVFITFADDLSVESDQLWLGVGSIFLSALTYAMYLVGSGVMIPKLGPTRFTAYAMTISCIMVIIHYSAINSYEVFNQPWQVYALGFSMAIFSTVIPSFLISESIKRIGASNFAIYGSIGPISTIILAIIFLGERIDLYQIIGTIVVLMGVGFINVKKSK